MPTWRNCYCYWEHLPYSLKYNCGWFACFHHRMEDMRHVYIQTKLCVCVCVCWALSGSCRNPVFPSHSSHGEKFLSSHSVTHTHTHTHTYTHRDLIMWKGIQIRWKPLLYNIVPCWSWTIVRSDVAQLCLSVVSVLTVHVFLVPS